MSTDVQTPKAPLKEQIPYQAALLGGFVAIAAALLVTMNLSTKAPIAARQAEDLQASLSQVVADNLHDNKLLENSVILKDAAGKEVKVYRGTQAGKVSALVWQTVGYGYAGEIKIIIAVDPDGKILGTRVLAHKETPGLGDKIEEAKGDWILKFTGLSIGNPSDDKWKVKKDGGQFDQFSGATITPRGVVKAIHEALQFFAVHKTELLETKS